MSQKRVVRSYSLPPDLVAKLEQYVHINMMPASAVVVQALEAALQGRIEIVPVGYAKPVKPKTP